jgi:excisionase family DNA binding protein
MADIDELLTVDEVAGRAKVNPETVRRWIKSGRLPAVKPAGGAYRIHSTDLERLFGTPPKAQAPSTPGQPDNLAGGGADLASLGQTLKNIRDNAAGLADSWNQDVDLYEQHDRAIHPYRLREMSYAVLFLQQQLFNALRSLRDDAKKRGFSTDMSTWEPQSKQLLIEVMASLLALYERYKSIERRAGDLRAMREEFDVHVDVRVPAFIADAPQWPVELGKARAKAGVP